MTQFSGCRAKLIAEPSAEDLVMCLHCSSRLLQMLQILQALLADRMHAVLSRAQKTCSRTDTIML